MMTLKRQLVHLLGALIVMIAAYLAPSAAQAHAGHSHAAGPAVTVDHTLENELPAPAATAVARARTTPASVLSVARPAPDSGDTPCRMGCCSPFGFGCCVGMMISAAAPPLPVQPTGGRVIAGPEDPRLGISPESLPKPPRAFV